MNLGLPELVVIFVVTLLVFGPKRLPELAKAMGKGIRDFKKALNEDEPTETQKLPEGQAQAKIEIEKNQSTTEKH